MEFFAVEGELEVALLVSGFRILGLPIAAVPELHRAAAILALRDRAFEIAVIERMVFHLHRQPLVMRVERGAACHCPGLEDAVELQPKIVVQPGRSMFLDHEAALP